MALFKDGYFIGILSDIILQTSGRIITIFTQIWPQI